MMFFDYKIPFAVAAKTTCLNAFVCYRSTRQQNQNAEYEPQFKY